jgi:hypothetical protein
VRASVVIRGSGGERVVAMDDFQHGPYETAVGDAEMLTEIRIPVRAGGSSAYAKVERRAGDWAVTSVGAAVWMDGATISDARVGLAAVGPNTTGIPAISDLLRGQRPSDELYAAAGAIAAASCSPATDNRGTADYKRHLADELTRRTLRRAVEQRAGGHQHPGGAEAALQAVALHEALLDRVQHAVLLQALDGAYVAAAGHRGQHRAGLHRLPVHPRDAGAAVAGVAAPVRPGQPELVAQEVHEQHPALDLAGHRLPVDGHRHLHVTPPFPQREPPPGAAPAG